MNVAVVELKTQTAWLHNIYVPPSHGDKHSFKVMFHYPKHVFKSVHACMVSIWNNHSECRAVFI